MAGGKQTPRQKLISLMYLIFLALMALNVSVEVLDSFPLINESIEQTNKNFEIKVAMVYDDFDKQRANSEDKVQPYYDQAQYVRQIADSLSSYILHQRSSMIALLNGISIEAADTLSLFDMKAKDNYSTSSNFWLRENNQDPTRDGGRGTRAYALREQLASFRQKVDSILTIHQLSAPISLDVEGPFYRQDFEISWQQLMFDRVISVAVATNLSRLITEIRNAEFDVISQLYSAITADDFKFDRIEARIVPNSQIIMLGENYEADIFVAAVDTRQTPQVFVGGQSVQTVDGVGKLRVRTSTEGQQTIRGVIRVTSPTGYPQEYPFSSTYIVQKPTATVSADRMNLFYAGIDNPISFSAPGVTSENLRPSVSAGAQLVQLDNGQWIVRVQPATSQVRVTVNAAMADGSTKNMGESTFRVRLVPDPMAFVGDRNEGRVTKQQLINAGGVSAEMKDFEFDMNYRIKSFTMLTSRAGFIVTYNATSNNFTNEMRQAINDATRDQRIFFTNIVTHPGPDGIERTLRDISFVIH